MEARRDGVITWDQMFMRFAQVAAMRSKDPSTQVGACIASPDNRVLSIGYNGAPAGFDDEDFPWGRDSEDPMCTKYPYVVHAEANAILNFRGARSELAESRLYVTHFCCNECAKMIAQTDIGEVIYLHDHAMSNGLTPATLTIFKHKGVKHRQMQP